MAAHVPQCARVGGIKTHIGKLAELAKTDELELLYLHLHSMRNFTAMANRLAGKVAPLNEQTMPAEVAQKAGDKDKQKTAAGNKGKATEKKSSTRKIQ